MHTLLYYARIGILGPNFIFLNINNLQHNLYVNIIQTCFENTQIKYNNYVLTATHSRYTQYKHSVVNWQFFLRKSQIKMACIL